MESQNDKSPADIMTASEDASPVASSPKKQTSVDETINRLRSAVFAPQLLNQKLGTGKVQNLSNRLTRYM